MVILLLQVSFNLYHVMTAGGFPIYTGKPIDLSSPNLNFTVKLDWVVDGLKEFQSQQRQISSYEKSTRANSEGNYEEDNLIYPDHNCNSCTEELYQ